MPRHALAATIFALVLAALAAPAPARADDAAAAAAFKSGDFATAAAAYAAVLKAQPNDPAAALGLGTIRLYENDLAAAKPLLEAAAAAAPSDARAQSRLRELRRRIGDWAQPATVDGDSTAIPFVTASPLPVVHLRVNGVEADFLVDTGGDFIIEPDFAARLGLAVRTGVTGTFAGGKQAPVSTALVDEVRIGGATARNVTASVFPTHASDAFPAGPHLAGVLGTSLFERFLVTLDYPHARLIFRPRSAAVSQAFQRAAAASGATVVPCWLVGDHLVIARASVNDAPSGLFLFDSGLAGGGISPSLELLKAAHIELDNTRASSGPGGGGTVATVPFVASSITVGNATIRNVAGIYTPEGSPLGIFPFTVWGIISNDYFKNFAYTVDFDAMKIVLER